VVAVGAEVLGPLASVLFQGIDVVGVNRVAEIEKRR
jgi:hypothetical protein